MKLTGYELKRAYFNKRKMERGCEMVKPDGTVCGYNEHPFALQLDHIDPSTKYRSKSGKLVNPGNLISRSQAIIDREFSLCRILCANCHMVYTYTEQRMSVGSDNVIDIENKRKKVA